MIYLDEIQRMIDFYDELIFVLPDKLSEDIQRKVTKYNHFRFLGIKNGSYCIEHEYADIDLLITEYYSDCFENQKISYANLFRLVRYMLVYCPSIAFSLEFSDKLSFFKVEKCNFYLDYFRILSKELTSDLAMFALLDYLINVFEDGRIWSNGKFYLNLLTEDNQEFLHQLSQKFDY